MADYAEEGKLHRRRVERGVRRRLARPRKIIIMVKAGAPVDAVLGELAPLLDDGDI